MSQITKQFPTLSEISPNISVEVFVMGKFEYVINTDVHLTNIRLWAIANDMTEHVVFVFGKNKIKLNPDGKLPDFPDLPIGFFDQHMNGIAEIFWSQMKNIKPTHYSI